MKRSAISVIGLLSLTVGCYNENSPLPVRPGEPAKTIRVMHASPERFMNDFGYSFQIKYPNIRLEFLSAESLQRSGSRPDDVIQFIIEQQPDLIALNPYTYQEPAVRKVIRPLEPYMQQSALKVEDFVPAVVDFLTDSGRSPLYGLTPGFTNQALYWNRELFDQYGVAYPQEVQSWEDVLNTAKRFHSKPQTVGLFMRSAGEFNPFHLFYRVTADYGLVYSHPDAVARLTGNPRFAAIWDSVMAAYRDGYVYNPLLRSSNTEEGSTGSDDFKTNLFLHGQAAMFIDTHYFLKTLQDAQSRSLAAIDWELSPIPVDPARPDVATTYQFQDIFAIYSGSASDTQAWLLLQHIHSLDTAKAMTQYNRSFGLSSLSAWVENAHEKSLAAFYRFTPEFSQQDAVPTQHKHLVQTYQQTAKEVSLRALDGSVTTIEALRDIGKAVERLYAAE